jgi:hypothetical protein
MNYQFVVTFEFGGHGLFYGSILHSLGKTEKNYEIPSPFAQMITGSPIDI